jgi:hypothetical protein
MRFKVKDANHEEAADKHSCFLGDPLSTCKGVLIAVDARELRNRATRRYYMKVPRGSGLDVQDPIGSDGSPYRRFPRFDVIRESCRGSSPCAGPDTGPA